ncbi:MAG: hypothetical protein ACC608_04720 [Anaerofustis sp.]|jgi:AcrR family transcriptional regulator
MGHFISDKHTKRKIYYACETLFYSKGYHNTHIEDIVNLAQITREAYDNFFSGKLEPAVMIYFALAKNNARIAALFGNSIDRLTGICLDLQAFWHLFFRDENIRRFSMELSAENIWRIKDTHPLYEECAALSVRRFSEREIEWNKLANVGIARQLNQDAYRIARDSKETSEFYIRAVFKLYEIDSALTNHIISRSQELFERCELSNDGFRTTFRMKQQPIKSNSHEL